MNTRIVETLEQPTDPAAHGPLVPGGPALPAALFVLLAIEGALLAALLCVHVIALDSYPHWQPRTGWSASDAWGWLQVIVLVLAGISIAAAVRCIRRAAMGWRAAAMLLLTAAMMYGAVFTGSLAAEMAAAADVTPSIRAELRAAINAMTPSAVVRAASSTADDADGAILQSRGDAVRGATAYRASCASCHGPQGDGLANLGLPLHNTPFMQQTSDEQLHAFIVRGRPANDPASQLGRLMPPRGGNPFLSDPQVDDIIAFLRQLGTDGPQEQVVAAVDTDQLVPRWVVPAAARGPQGLSSPWLTPADRAALVLDTATTRGGHAADPAASGPTWVPLTFVLLQGVHVMIAMAIAARLLMAVWGKRRDRATAALCRAARVYWLTAAAAWLVLLPLLSYRP